MNDEINLPALPEPYSDACEESRMPALFEAEQMYQFRQEGIAADRASRQVANKAEVEPIGYIHSVDLGKSGFTIFSPAEFRSWPLGKKADISPYIPVYATPPATTGGANATPTGASTVLMDELQAQVDKWHKRACDEREKNVLLETQVRMYEAEVAAQAGQVAVPFKWPNGCDETVPRALRYLANNTRPSGGEEHFNSVHLYQLAGEIEQAARKMKESK